MNFLFCDALTDGVVLTEVLIGHLSVPSLEQTSELLQLVKLQEMWTEKWSNGL